MAYIILDDAIASILVRTYEFIPVNKINYFHNALPYTQYIVAGYPEVNINVDVTQKKITTGCSIFLLTMAKEKVYQYYGLDASRHYILTFAGKGTDMETNERTAKIEDPHGMSGCGLWLLTEKPNTDAFQLQYHLIGIMTEFRKDKYHCLIGNRIDLIMAALVQLEGFNL